LGAEDFGDSQYHDVTNITEVIFERAFPEQLFSGPAMG